ncbi:esag4 [Trypanosoma rangeli]|uniref:adenylate cyclase n=1 Tax=Trypanosoma rangeli TaxID=5698 RepID=A0A3R7M6J4_TRYRA|nr:esag4 [Trypanosoma rangeli]RNE97079.1 esag4 [Trypanosoma rangeli]|eukprot:RNE97079.1 esag4 [Trypanosoma rangeli]
MQDYLENSGQTDYADKDHFLKNDGDGELMVSGWIAGEVLAQALSNGEWLSDHKTFVASLFDQRRYMVGDLVIGDYGGECKGAAASQGATCYCNEGGRTVYMKRFVEDYRARTVKEGLMTFRLSDCDALDTFMPPVFSGMAFLMTDNGAAQRAFGEIRFGFMSAYIRPTGWWEPGEISIFPRVSTLNSSRDALQSQMQSRRVHGVFGVVTEAMLDVGNVVFIDPLLLEPRLNRFRRYAIHLSPTLEQEFFVLAKYLGNTSVRSAHAVIRGEEAAAVADVLRRSLVTSGVSLQSPTLLAGGDALAGHLPAEGDVFVVGLAAVDVAAIAKHVASHGSVRVFVAFSEFALLHADFVAAFDGGAGADRVVFATSLPHWNDANSTSETAQEFIRTVTDATQRTPLSLMGFASTQLLQTVLSRMDKVTAELLAAFFYRSITVTVKDMQYGSFADGTACDAADGAVCAKNYGATYISVWSLARALDPAVPVLFPAVTPSMEYVEPAAHGLVTAQLVGIAIAVVFLVAIIVVAIIVVVLCCCRDSRDNANAPKEPTDPVTLVFTDIESSTALWAACSELMPDAVATHHQLIRALIAKYGCYEVKTIGDSFMIACKSVFAAVQLVRELQQVFLQQAWGTSVLDDAYRKFEEGRAEEDVEGYVPPTAHLDAAVYRQYWSGLRVRVGVHTGLCDIRRDEVTKGYDYYGDTANMAARTESVGNGGQVLLTRAAYMALSTAEREEVDVTALGTVALRGVPQPVEMYQVDAVPGRTFAALRLDREAAELYDGLDVTLSSGEASASSSLGAVGHAILSVLVLLFGAVAVSQRLKLLRPLCERWRVDVPRGVGAGHEVEACSVAMERLAARMGRVMKNACKAADKGGSHTGSSPRVSLLGNDCLVQLLNTTYRSDSSFGEWQPRHIERRSSLSTAEEAWSATDGSDATIHIRQLV